MIPQRYVLLDRDGTINIERHYLSDPDHLELLPGAAAGLRTMREMGLGLIVVTNQSGIARGYFSQSRLDEVHAKLWELLEAEGVEIDAIYVCPHAPDDHCECRKPRPGLIRQAARDCGFRPEECFVIGDKECDIELGRSVGATTLLVKTGYGQQTATVALSTANRSADYVVENLKDAAATIGRCLAAEDVAHRRAA